MPWYWVKLLLPRLDISTSSLSAWWVQVYVPPHPLIKHWVAVLRNKLTPDVLFRSACAELGRLLIYEAARDWLPVLETEVDN